MKNIECLKDFIAVMHVLKAWSMRINVKDKGRWKLLSKQWKEKYVLQVTSIKHEITHLTHCWLSSSF